jgi:ribose 5-phosphate isomerase A
VNDGERLRALARVAADEVQSGMTLGLGTGSTAEAVIHELGARVEAGLQVRAVATSSRTELLAKQLHIQVVELVDCEQLDLGIDGADEVDPRLDLVKGHGGALLREKLVALACRDYLIVAAAEKRVPQLGSRKAVPVEVVPFGWRQTGERLARLGCLPVLRLARTDGSGAEQRGEPFVSDGGHYVLDCETGPLPDAARLAEEIKLTSGAVDHGLFLGLARQVMLVEKNGSITRLKR